MAGLSWAEDFAHLHVASSYSLRYGVAGPAALAARAAELGMPALALTERDGLYGAVKHAVACAEVGIAPILGADMALGDDSRTGKRAARKGSRAAGQGSPGGDGSRAGGRAARPRRASGRRTRWRQSGCATRMPPG